MLSVKKLRVGSAKKMDNFGYKEPGAAPKPSRRVRMKRAPSVYSQSEKAPPTDELPLSAPKHKTAANSIRWRNDPEMALDEEMPSDDFEYMLVGPSPPAESAPNMYDSYEEPSTELSVQICSDTIRTTLTEQARLASVRTTLLDDIESSALTPEAAFAAFENATKPEKNICFLWCAFHKRRDLLDPMLRAGADINFQDSTGMTAIHLSSFVGCIECISALISRGADVNGMSKCFSPLHCTAFGNHPEAAKLLIRNGAMVSTATKRTNCEETILHCAVRANAVECLQVFIAEGVDVNSIEPSGANAVHLAADLGMTKCLEILLNSKDVDVNSRTRIRDKESTALHLAADEGNVECVDLLLSKGADTKLKNHRGFTALHLAARSSSLECVESLLRNGNADPNAEDYDKRTPLHAAIGKSESAFDIIETLISWGANVNQKDEYGFTPLHLASLDGLSHCVETLIYHGADVTTKSKKGNSALNVITRKTPASMAMITQKLDGAITLHNAQDSSNREVELELDFRNILQHCHPREISYLNTFVDEGQKEILLHPLCSAFLHIKWEKIRKYYIARLFFCFMFVLFLTLYVLTALAHNCYNSSKDMEGKEPDQELCQKQSILGDLLRKNPFVIEMQWWVLAAITIFEIFRKVYGIAGYSTVKQYLTQPENIIEWFVIVSVFLISYIYTNSTYTWQNHVGAFAVLAGWTNLMLMIGQLPVFGSYVAMYQKVQKEFAKLFMAYSCILIGFTISFCVIFPDSSSFSNPFMGFITVLTMMIGELDLGLLKNDPNGNDPPFLLEISAQITYVLFLMFVTVVLMNLLVGIAVHDIQGLRKTAGLSKLVRQTKLISYMELALFNAFLPRFLSRMLHRSALVSPQAYRVVLSVKPLNPGEKRLPRDVMMAAYDIAKVRKNNGHTISFKTSSATTNTFRKYNNNNIASMSDYGYDSGLCALQMKVNEESERIESLTDEIRELKEMIKSQQAMIKKLLCKDSTESSTNC